MTAHGCSSSGRARWLTAAAAPTPATSTALQAVDIARAQTGKPYVWGGKGPDVFDCSGLMQYVYGQLGVTIGTSTHSQRYNG